MREETHQFWSYQNTEPEYNAVREVVWHAVQKESKARQGFKYTIDNHVERRFDDPTSLLGKEVTYNNLQGSQVMGTKVLYRVYLIDRQAGNADPIAAAEDFAVLADNPESARTIALLTRGLSVAELGNYHVHAEEVCRVPLLPAQLPAPVEAKGA